MELHPLCTLFPRLTGAEFEALCDDIKANGLREAIVTHDDKILDGGNRYRACIEAGIEPVFEVFKGDSLVSFVLSKNLHRRHLSAGQQAAIVAGAQDWAKAQPAARPSKAGNVAGLSTVAQRAAQSGAGERTQRMADKVAKADPVLAQQVAHGEVSLPAAVRQVDGKRTPTGATAPAPAFGLATAIDDTDALRKRIAILVEENDRLNDRIAVEAMDYSEEERTAAAELIIDLRRRLLVLSTEVSGLQSMRDSLLVENGELKHQIGHLQRKLKTTYPRVLTPPTTVTSTEAR